MFIEKIHVSLKSDKKEDVHTFITLSCPILSQSEKYFSQSCRENQNTHFMFNKLVPKILHL